MFRLPAIAIAVLMFVSALSAQIPVAKDVDWRTFAPVTDAFQVEVPFNLEREGGTGSKKSRKYRASYKETYLYVFSDPIDKPENYRVVSSLAASNGRSLSFRENNGGPVKVKFTDSSGFYHRIIAMRNAERIYIAQSISATVDDKLASRFMGSFMLKGDEPVDIEEQQPLREPVVSNETAPNPPGWGSGVARTGQGSGSGSGSGFGSNLPPVTPGQTSGLRILSKTKPSYTDLARFYEIHGTVLVRVNFLSNGQIGAVTVMKKLVFLTDQAVTAAKGLRFIPPYRDGEAVTITKQVEYTFSIY